MSQSSEHNQTTKSDVPCGQNEDYWSKFNKDKMPFSPSDSQLFSSQSCPSELYNCFSTSTPFQSQNSAYNSTFNYNRNIHSEASTEFCKVSSRGSNETLTSEKSTEFGSTQQNPALNYEADNESDSYYTAKSFNFTFDENK